MNGYEPLELFTYLGVIVVVLAVVFLVTRQVYLWYFRINEIVETLKSADKSLQQIAFYLSGQELKQSKKVNPDKWECNRCGASNELDVYKCSSCGYMTRQE